MTTDYFLSTPSTVTVAGLLVAGLGAVYAYTQHTHAHAHAHTTRPSASTSGAIQKGTKKKKGKGVDVGAGVGVDEGGGGGRGGGGPAIALPFPRVATVPGDFEGVGTEVDADVGTHVGSQEASLAVTTASNQKGGKKTKTTKKKNKRKQKKQGKGDDRDEHEEEEEETGKEVGVDDVGRTAAHGPRSGDSTDASVSLSPSVSVSALGSSRAMGKGNPRASTRLAPPSQPREIRSSLSLDTDSSWTHVDRHRLKTSRSVDGQVGGPTDAMGVTSSDVASTTSDSPVVERMDGVTTDIRGARADLVQRTLAEKLVPRPSKTGVDDMLEQPDFPTLARVMRVQPPADETPVPGFSWEDYGDVVEENVLNDDADQEDEGEWGIIKSRHHTRSSQMTMTSNSTSHASTATETMTKRQRQNARKRELVKSARAEAEAMRTEGLAKHKRELERLRIIEQSQRGGGKRPSGGMQATVDDRGKLVWE
ncbi:hypothetical protein J3R82DRAFT_8354 [Butyriboletus roseoflavus]|nr:hypothetical protein J3R82DRAFT_8354 [Butyriboletus roseoflavus]